MGLLRAEGFSERANVIVSETGKVLYVKVYPIKELPDINKILAVLGARKDQRISKVYSKELQYREQSFIVVYGMFKGFTQLFSTLETWTNETFGELSFSMKNLMACAVWGKG